MLIYSSFSFFMCWNTKQSYANMAVSPAGVAWESSEQSFVFSLKDQYFKMCEGEGSDWQAALIHCYSNYDWIDWKLPQRVR